MTKQTRDILIKGASLVGGDATDIALSGGVIVAIGTQAGDAVRDPRRPCPRTRHWATQSSHPRIPLRHRRACERNA